MFIYAPPLVGKVPENFTSASANAAVVKGCPSHRYKTPKVPATVFTANPRRAMTASARPVFFMGNLYGFPKNLVLQRLIAQDPLKLTDTPLEGFHLGRPDDVLIDPYRFLPTLGHAPSRVKNREGEIPWRRPI
jgi:hypothetical protein